MRKGMMKDSGKRGYHNIIGKDPMVHSQSAKGIKQPQKAGFLDRVLPQKKVYVITAKYDNNENWQGREKVTYTSTKPAKVGDIIEEEHGLVLRVAKVEDTGKTTRNPLE
jgi:hypothetical protein